MLAQQANTTTIDKFLIGTIKYLAEGFAKKKSDLLSEEYFGVELYGTLNMIVEVRAKFVEVDFPGVAQMDELLEVLSTFLSSATSLEWQKHISK